MSPAFSSPKSAAGFALLLLLLLLAPALAGRALLPPRDQIYSSAPERWGPYAYFHRQIFEETNEADIVFMGSSHIGCGIDTPRVQRELSRKLGRDATVFSLGWPYAGFDGLYFIARDLLQHRRVKMLVIQDEFAGTPIPHFAASRLFRFADDAEVLRGLPLNVQAGFYAEAIRGMPRNLLGLVRPNLPVDASPGRTNAWEGFYHAPGIESRLGTLTARIGFDYDPEFADFTPATPALPAEVRVYSAETKSDFEFSGPPTPPAQLHFARQLAELAKAHGTKLVFIHLPEFTEMRAENIHEREIWPEALGADAAMLGVPPAKLFRGISDDEVRKLYYDPGHLNQNGQAWFTQFITPALLDIYESKANF